MAGKNTSANILICAAIIFLFVVVEAGKDINVPLASDVGLSPLLAEKKGVRSLGFGVVSRSSDSVDTYGFHQPPWKSQSLSFGLLSVRPEVGDSVTVVPTRGGLKSLNYSVGEVKGRKPCVDSLWSIQTEVVRSEKYRRAFSEQESYRVLVIYPAVQSAHVVDADDWQGWPDGLTSKAVRVAVSTSEDDEPDLVAFEHCCDDEEMRPQDAEYGCYSCGSFFVREEDDWELVSSWGPC